MISQRLSIIFNLIAKLFRISSRAFRVVLPPAGRIYEKLCLILVCVTTLHVFAIFKYVGVSKWSCLWQVTILENGVFFQTFMSPLVFLRFSSRDFRRVLPLVYY